MMVEAPRPELHSLKQTGVMPHCELGQVVVGLLLVPSALQQVVRNLDFHPHDAREAAQVEVGAER
jgi:hypothetical protein